MATSFFSPFTVVYPLLAESLRSFLDKEKTLTKSGAMEVFEYVDVIATLARRHEPSQATMLHPSASRLFYSERKEEGRP